MEAAELICWSEFEFLKIHHKNVGDLSSSLAREIGVPLNEIKNIRYAAQHHDVGKLLISQNILNKRGKLTVEEFEIMKQHPAYSFEILKNNGVSLDICNMVKYHHECFSGSEKGYFGLRGTEIPLGARIIKVCDYFDALVSDRAYRKALTIIEAFQIMDVTQREFDPAIYDIFKKLYNIKK